MRYTKLQATWVKPKCRLCVLSQNSFANPGRRTSTRGVGCRGHARSQSSEHETSHPNRPRWGKSPVEKAKRTRAWSSSTVNVELHPGTGLLRRLQHLRGTCIPQLPETAERCVISCASPQYTLHDDDHCPDANSIHNHSTYIKDLTYVRASSSQPSEKEKWLTWTRFQALAYKGPWPNH